MFKYWESAKSGTEYDEDGDILEDSFKPGNYVKDANGFGVDMSFICFSDVYATKVMVSAGAAVFAAIASLV